MSYFDRPRLHFSGGFNASPSTINNTPNNFDPLVYPTPNQLKGVELYWNPLGNGAFAFVDCVVTRVDYPDGTSAVTPEEDPIIGQSVAAIQRPNFKIPAALVDLDPMQQNVTEIFGMNLQIGGSRANLVGSFKAVSFSSIWGQAQGANAPHSSASGSGIYQSKLVGVQLQGDVSSSRFLTYFAETGGSELSINFNLNAHNNGPPLYSFNGTTFEAMRKAPKPVPEDVLAKLEPMKDLIENVPGPNGPREGDVPTRAFTKYMIGQYLGVDESDENIETYNAHIDTILSVTEQPYTGSTSQEFCHGLTTGTIGPIEADAPDYFVANRMMYPRDKVCFQQSTGKHKAVGAFSAPFTVQDGGHRVVVNLGNSLPTELPGATPWSEPLGKLLLVAFPDGLIDLASAVELAEIPYTSSSFITQQAGFFSAEADRDFSALPLGIVSEHENGGKTIVLAEDSEGYYLRADQFIYRMNPGTPTSAEFPRGNSASVTIHARRYGEPVPDGTRISLKMMNVCEAESYTVGTLGTSGTRGIENLSTPQGALLLREQVGAAETTTLDGVAHFALTCTDPGNPRGHVNGQIYFLNYMFADPAIAARLERAQDPNDIVSVQVYDQHELLSAPEVLAKWGRVYKIMDFLTDEAKVSQIDRRNLIKQMLEQPFSEVEHMPLTRDFGAAARTEVISWINELNNP